MTTQRLAELLICHALADGQPVGPILRALPSRAATWAARLADAGKLDQALGQLGFPRDQAWVAERWPSSLRPALARMARIPQALVFQAPLLQLLGYFSLVALLQLFIVLLLQRNLLPTLTQMPMSSLSASDPTLIIVAVADLVLLTLSLSMGAWAVFGKALGPRSLGWRASLVLAREAALAASLHDCGAPEALRSAFVRSCTQLEGRGAEPSELDLIFESALADAAVSLQRTVSVLRVVGYCALSLLAVLALAGIMHDLAQMGLRL